MMDVHVYPRNLLVFLWGCVLMTQAVYYMDTWPTNVIKENEIEPVQPIVQVKDLNEEQRNIFFNNNKKPKMIEKTKIMNRVRQLKDQGEEKLKVVYRTRIIGQFDPKTILDITTNDKLFEWPIESDEDGEFSNEIGRKTSVNKDEQEFKAAEKEFDTLQNNEMPLNQHSAKKELHSNMHRVRSMENVADETNYEENKPATTNTKNIENNEQSPGRTAFRKVNFAESKEDSNKMKLDHPTNTQQKTDFMVTIEDENETGFKRPISPVKKLVDSLELYKNQQLKAAQVMSELKSIPIRNTVPINHNNTPKPILKRQFSFYHHPTIHFNPVNNLGNIETKYPATNKPVFPHPLDTIILMPAQRNVNTNVNNIKEPNPLNSSSNKVNPEPKPTIRPLKPDWIGDLLLKKVAQVQAEQMARVRAAQVQLNEAQHKQQEILQQEQQRHPKIAI